MGQIRSPGHSFLLPYCLPVPLGKALPLLCVAFLLLALWGQQFFPSGRKNSPQGSGSRRLLLGAAVQPWSTCRGRKQSWRIVTCHLLHTRFAGSAPPSQSLMQVPSASGDPFQCLPLLARMWGQIWPHDNQEGKLVAWAE